MNEPMLHEEAFNVLCGEQLGEGIHRRVFACKFDETLVVKVEYETNFHIGTNAAEYRWWMDCGDVPWIADHLAPCVRISPNSRVLIQRRCQPVRVNELPEKMPSFLMDIKPENFGWYNGRIVCHDYPMLNTTISKRFKKVNWRLDER
jgi:hypothetical protein